VTESQSIAQRLCLACGLCCNGVLFKDVELQAGDDAARLKAMGLPVQVRPAGRKARFPQPCVALCADNLCRIYADRPARCRDFECALFQAVAGGQTDTAAALRTIRLARQRADNVRRLLRAVGDADDHLALSLRFRRTKQRLEAGFPHHATADRFAELTLAVHDLNVLLGQSFLPDPGRNAAPP
jgi:hypothetical protein